MVEEKGETGGIGGGNTQKSGFTIPASMGKTPLAGSWKVLSQIQSYRPRPFLPWWRKWQVRNTGSLFLANTTVIHSFLTWTIWQCRRHGSPCWESQRPTRLTVTVMLQPRGSILEVPETVANRKSSKSHAWTVFRVLGITSLLFMFSNDCSDAQMQAEGLVKFITFDEVAKRSSGKTAPLNAIAERDVRASNKQPMILWTPVSLCCPCPEQKGRPLSAAGLSLLGFQWRQTQKQELRKPWHRPGPALKKSLPFLGPQFPPLDDQGSNTLRPIHDSGGDY